MIIKPEIKEILSGYQQKVFAYDEFWLNQDAMHPHWLDFMDQLTGLGLEEVQQRSGELQRLIEDAGVTYNIYQQQGSSSIPWKIDPIPYLIAPHIWDMLEKGVRQRAKLLNLLLKDLYGPQEVIQAGVLPAEVIHADRNFLRPCYPYRTDIDFQLLMYASDISRSPDGRLWVVGDRTQAPSGWSYMMVNRIALARILPELFLKSRIKKIVPFFQQLRTNLIAASPKGNENPLIVLLTPGQYNETYFEHGYLASLQGYTLAKGDDLMVKEGFLWLKTLSGLEKVDILVRHVDDNFCDPLALRSDSQLGIAGLLEVVRKGNVIVANPLGSGVLENPALMAFMPSLCQFYLSESLIIPNIASWWCGDPDAKEHVVNNLKRLIIKRIDKRGGDRTVFGPNLNQEQLIDLRKKIDQVPYLYVGQEQAIFATTPSLSQRGHLEPRHMVLRCFSVASPNEYQVLPGGLTRSAPELGKSKVSNRSGALGKDTWVISSEEIKQIGFRFSDRKPKYTYRGIEELSSGIASNMFWVGRYLARVRHTVNLIRIILKYFAEIDNFKDPIDNEILSLLLKALTHMTLTYPGFVGENGAENRAYPEKEIRALIMDRERIGSLSQTISMLKGATNNIRNLWSEDTWRVLDKLHNISGELRSNPSQSIRSLRNKLDELLDATSASFGFIQRTLSIEAGGPLFEVGFEMEDGILKSSLMRSLLTVRQDDRVEDGILEAFLLTTGNLVTYRHRYRGDVQIIGVLELILLDRFYPGSLTVSLERLLANLEVLPQRPTSGGLRKDEKQILSLVTALKVCDAHELAQVSNEEMLRSQLDELLGSLNDRLFESTNLIINRFFSHTTYKTQKSEFLFDPDF